VAKVDIIGSSPWLILFNYRTLFLFVNKNVHEIYFYKNRMDKR
jgi:hypothetical protein